MLPSVRRRDFVALAACCLLVPPRGPAPGPGPDPHGEAFRGEPFGVGRVEVDVTDSSCRTRWEPTAWASGPRTIALYPTVECRPVLDAARDLLGEAKRPMVKIIGGFLDRPGHTSIYFLFVGDGPLELSVGLRRIDRLTLVPRIDRLGYRRLLTDWWRYFERRPGPAGEEARLSRRCWTTTCGRCLRGG